jgi:cysteine desulfurase
MEVYFDNAATTKPSPEARNILLRLLDEDYGNPSSGHMKGRRAAEYLENARRQVARAVGAREGEIIFTSGGTEANNLALQGAVEAMRHEGKHIITTAIEHDSVKNAAAHLEQKGFEVTYLAPDSTGKIDVADLECALREDTVLVSVMAVNNETGSINPVTQIAKILKSNKSPALFHVDAVQAFGKMPLNAKKSGADLMTFSGHKIHGVRGAGALYIKKGVKIKPLIFGGGHEQDLRPGTEALPAIAAFGEAARISSDNLEEISAAISEIRDYILEELARRLPEAVVIGGGAPHIVSMSMPGYKSEVLMNYLDAEGICVSRGSACKKGGRSHVLAAMKLPDKIIDGTLRLSFSEYNTVAEAEYFITTMCQARDKFKNIFK